MPPWSKNFVFTPGISVNNEESRVKTIYLISGANLIVQNKNPAIYRAK